MRTSSGAGSMPSGMSCDANDGVSRCPTPEGAAAEHAGVPGGAGRTAIIVAESRGLVRAGLAGLLATWPHGPVCPAATLDQVLALVDAEPGAVLLLDLDLLGNADPAGLGAVRARAPGVRVIAMAGRNSRDGILACLAAGAHGFVARTAEFAELARAIETVRGGGVHVPATLATPAEPVPASLVPAPAASAPILTGRQQDVLRLLAEGRSTKDIARTLDLAVSTIKVHLAALYRTVGAHNRVEALCRAGILPSMRQAA